MPAALKMVKQEFGVNAVILSARTLERSQGVLGMLKRPGVEVTAATDIHADHSLPRLLPEREQEELEVEPEQGIYNRRGLLAGMRDGSDPLVSTRNHAVKEPRCAEGGSQQLFDLYGEMVARNIDEELAGELINIVSRIEDPEQLENPATRRTCLAQILEETGVIVGPFPELVRQRTIAALVGPTGVGKTSTIAKIAARYAFTMKKKVALATTDTNRIGAIEQLRTYATIMDLPLTVACNKMDLQELLRSTAEADLVLIDTAGVGQNDSRRLHELKTLLDDIRSLEVHLVVSATTKKADMADIVERFSIIPVSRLLVTKTDETVSCGPVLNQILRTKLPISFVTHGQGIADDLAVATPGMLVGWMLGEETEKESEGPQPQKRATLVQPANVQAPYPNKFYIANKNSDVFHYHSCKWAKKIKAKNMIVFNNKYEALKEELKPCRLCIPEEAEREESLTRMRLSASAAGGRWQELGGQGA